MSYHGERPGGHHVNGRLWLAVLIAAALAVTIAACNRLPPDCRTDDQDDRQMSTRVLFLERLDGCPIGGRN